MAIGDQTGSLQSIMMIGILDPAVKAIIPPAEVIPMIIKEEQGEYPRVAVPGAETEEPADQPLVEAPVAVEQADLLKKAVLETEVQAGAVEPADPQAVQASLQVILQVQGDPPAVMAEAAEAAELVEINKIT